MNRHLRIAALGLALALLPLAAAGKPPFWDKVIGSPKRFKVLKGFGDAAVLDKETGLVWERSPTPDPDDPVLGCPGGVCVSGSCDGGVRDFSICAKPTEFQGFAVRICATKRPGQVRGGFRLPSVSELASLTDPTQGDGLPAGHPFVGVEPTETYWTTTPDPSIGCGTFGPANFTVRFDGSNPISGACTGLVDQRYWCVRAGIGN